MPFALAAIPTWGLMAIGAGLFLAVVAVLAVVLRRRPVTPGSEADPGIAWGNPHGELPPEPAPSPASYAPVEAPGSEAAPPSEPAGPVHSCRCPSCQTQFTVNGPKPIVTNCPGCGKKGFLR